MLNQIFNNTLPNIYKFNHQKEMEPALHNFHPLIQKWFSSKFDSPTDIQEFSWPKIAQREHVLITAPTGSGKTLTAFLWAINQLVSGQWESDQTSVLYISPLKALNNDIKRNLSQPLKEIGEVFEQAGEKMPQIRVFTRSGDTSQSDRRRMLRHPPEILITTPESLNLLLSSNSGREVLSTLSTVILDEIHAVVDDKRGVHLITAVDRLVRLSGEFQRISLSATVKPLETVAEYVGGFKLEGGLHNPRYRPRDVSIIKSQISKTYEVKVVFPEDATRKDIDDSIWDSLAKEFHEIIQGNRSTLLFANSRKLSEKLTYKVNNNAMEPVAYAHHGSLSKEIREEVESKLKHGDLKAIVATSSLEMGIDIGDLDEVVLIQSPSSVSSAIQRIGRAGHHVGEISKGTIFPSHAQDFISAAVLVNAINEQDIEAVRPIECPLDVLAQVIISMVGVEPWDMDDLFRWIKTSVPYRHLSREQYDLVLNMLAGRYADSRIRELKPRISIDRLDNTVQGKKGSLLAVYMSGGTIPDRGYFQLRHQESGARIGELDEEYVWEARIGQIATIGTQNWKIQKITHNDVFATPVGNKIMDTPFWKSEEFGRDFHFSNRISTFLEHANENLKEPEFKNELKAEHQMDSVAVRELIDFLNRQKEDTHSDLPHRHHILLEYVHSGPDGAPGSQLVIHTLWGGQVNRPFSMALDAAWEERFGERLEVFPGNDCIILQLAHEIRPEEVLSMVTSSSVEELLRKRLEGSGYFSARFRECAGRALLITRNRMSERMPLWMTRLRSQKLLEGILQYDDFPILLETWRTCLQDEFDMDGLRQVLSELESGEITWSIANTSKPSPFAAGMTWNQIDKYMYQLDQPASTASALRGNLIRDVVFSPSLRPTISKEVVEKFEQKRQRLFPGYAPTNPRDLVDWVKERIAIPLEEWNQLLISMERNLGKEEAKEIEKGCLSKIVKLDSAQTKSPLIVSIERLDSVVNGFFPQHDSMDITGLTGEIFDKNQIINGDPQKNISDELTLNLFREWIQFYGPRQIQFYQSTLGLPSEVLSFVLEGLVESQAVISGQLIQDSDGQEFCDSENFEILLRISRASAVPEFKALNIEFLPLFFAHFQGLVKKQDSVDDLFQRLEQLICLPLNAEFWESELLPARLSPYDTSWLDTIMQQGDLRWLGQGKNKIAFCFESDLDLLNQISEPEDEAQDEEVAAEENPLSEIFENSDVRYDFSSLIQKTKLLPNKLTEKIWESVWQGIITNDTFASLRKGIESKFKLDIKIETKPLQRQRGRRSGSRGGFAKWKNTLPFVGNWFRPDFPEKVDDILELEELKKDRVRLLLDRYGILFRELLLREVPDFRWSSVFRSLRLMELSGEILAGYFFEDIPGPQFISHAAFRILQSKLPEDRIYWVNASDPASLCGIQIDTLKATLPKRMQFTHIAFKGTAQMLISERNGKVLTINAEPTDKDIQQYFAPLKNLLFRQFSPLKQIVIELINGEDAAKSPYLDPLKTAFEVLVEFKKITLYRKI